jgi:hypothetical protein
MRSSGILGVKSAVDWIIPPFTPEFAGDLAICQEWSESFMKGVLRRYPILQQRSVFAFIYARIIREILDISVALPRLAAVFGLQRLHPRGVNRWQCR